MDAAAASHRPQLHDWLEARRSASVVGRGRIVHLDPRPDGVVHPSLRIDRLRRDDHVKTDRLSDGELALFEFERRSLRLNPIDRWNSIDTAIE